MPEQTIDNAVSELGAVAEQALEPIVASKIDLFAARGHQIISENMARAHELARSYPAVGALIPVIEGTLRSLLSHLLAGPDAAAPELPPSRVENVAPVLQRRPAEVASDAVAPAAEVDPAIAAGDPSNPNQAPAFPPIRDDKV